MREREEGERCGPVMIGMTIDVPIYFPFNFSSFSSSLFPTASGVPGNCTPHVMIEREGGAGTVSHRLFKAEDGLWMVGIY